MKKYFNIIFLCLLIFTSLIGCAPKESTNTPSNVSNEPKKYVIGLSFPAADHGWTYAVGEYAKQQAEASKSELPGLEYEFKAASDANIQTVDIEEFINKKVDAIVMLPVDSDTMTASATKIKAANIPLVIVDRAIRTEDYTAFICGNNKEIGTNAGKRLVEKLNGKGNILEIAGIPNISVTEERSQGFNEAVKDSQIKVLDTVYANFSREQAEIKTRELLEKYKNFDAIYSHDDDMTIGILKVLKEKGIKTIVESAGGMKEIYKEIQAPDSLVDQSFRYSPEMSMDGVKLAVKILKGESVEKKVVIPATGVDKTNVSQYYREDALY